MASAEARWAMLELALAGQAELVADINENPHVPDIDPIHHSYPGNFIVFDDILYFTADDGIHGRELLPGLLARAETQAGPDEARGDLQLIRLGLEEVPA